LKLGVSVMVTAVPTDVEVPLTVITPAVVTVPAVTFPELEIDAPAFAGWVAETPAFVCIFSVTVVFAFPAASTSSDTFARIV
jgi:hypothetical protein